MINLEAYPLDRPETDGYRRVIAEGGRSLAQTGLINLEGFLTPLGTSRLVAEIEALMPEAHYARRRDNPYGAPISDELADDHPASTMFAMSCSGVPSASSSTTPSRAPSRSCSAATRCTE